MTPIFALVLVALPQEGRPVRPKTSVKVPVSAAPVTATEARNSFAKIVTLVQKVNGLKLGAVSIPNLNRAVTRDEVIAEMARLYKLSEPGFKFTPAALPVDPSVLKVSAAQRASLSKLITRGCIAPVGPLAVGPANTLTVDQFGDALGYFSARITQLSHLPSSRWSPTLMDRNGG